MALTKAKQLVPNAILHLTNAMTEQQYHTILVHFEKNKHINLEFAPTLDVHGVLEALRIHPDATAVFTHGCAKLTAADLNQVKKRFPQTTGIFFCSQILEADFTILQVKCKMKGSVNLENLAGLDIMALMEVIQLLPTAKKIFTFGCSKLQDVQLMQLKQSREFTGVPLLLCHQISEAELNALETRCKQTKSSKINIEEHRGIDSEGACVPHTWFLLGGFGFLNLPSAFLGSIQRRAGMA